MVPGFFLAVISLSATIPAPIREGVKISLSGREQLSRHRHCNSGEVLVERDRSIAGADAAKWCVSCYGADILVKRKCLTETALLRSLIGYET
jgi:hypothetical protein